MKNFGKYILKYVLFAAFAFVATVLLTTYFKDGSFGFNPNYITKGLTIAITFFATAGLLIYDLLRILDGKGKKKEKGPLKDLFPLMQKI